MIFKGHLVLMQVNTATNKYAITNYELMQVKYE